MNIYILHTCVWRNVLLMIQWVQPKSYTFQIQNVFPQISRFNTTGKDGSFQTFQNNSYFPLVCVPLLPNMLIVCTAKTFNLGLFLTICHSLSPNHNSNGVWQTGDSCFCLLCSVGVCRVLNPVSVKGATANEQHVSFFLLWSRHTRNFQSLTSK